MLDLRTLVQIQGSKFSPWFFQVCSNSLIAFKNFYISAKRGTVADGARS